MTRNKIIFYNPNLKEKARSLRIKCTPSETLLWSRIRRRSLGHEFHRQVPIDEYIVDFYCKEKNLVIEIDGSQHLEAKEYDIERENYMKPLGIKTLRFWNNEIDINIENVLMKIKSEF